MKNLIFLLFLLPLMAVSQGSTDYPVITNLQLTPLPGKIVQFEQGLAEHNKKFHADGGNGARVYWVSSGKNAGRYMWVMGPTTWSAMDTPIQPEKEHNDHWNQKIAPFAETVGRVDYWRFHPEYSNFPADFDIDNLLVFVMDIKPFKGMQAIEIVKKVQKLYMEKYPDEPYGVYVNELSNLEGQDLAWVDFFGNMNYMSRPDTFPQDFETVHGEGSFMKFLKEVEDSVEGTHEELWVYRPDLSGLGPKVTAASRQ
ncbi:hypothetical protein [Zeaxanthinibacter enoshimensis]|uniref:Uncharacterized protein n=1 Tax=Zeaxanthinibacter enoshimensis TaxID=392009 RepID=A0A4R6TJB0_9FLAO|nr:hypothetical protein [Zeaxanthinibacter enoshimensis]TDQ29390.1 hypothetical protein CLV82_2848 [Zeaxanthinibacter enoshimensis]